MATRSEVMKSAWKSYKTTFGYVKYGYSRKAFSLELKYAWERTKEAEVKKIAKKNRTVTTLAKAIKDGLNHGKSWIANQYHVDKYQLKPWEIGEEICYVY